MKKADVEDRWTMQDVADYFKVDLRTAERMPIERIRIVMPGRKKAIVRVDPKEVFAYEARMSTKKQRAS